MNNSAIIIRPVVTEKSTSAAEKKAYTFVVTKSANKISVKKAIKELFGADVETVRILKVVSKKRMYKNGLGVKRASAKKAIVTLKGKADLDTTKFANASETKVAKVTKAKKAPKKTSKKSE